MDRCGEVGRKQDSPDPENEEGIYDGFGLFNAPISNIVVDDQRQFARCSGVWFTV